MLFRSASMAKKSEALVPYSKLKFRIAEILRDEGFVTRVEKIEDRFGSIRIKLRYTGNQPKISAIKRISKPGHRIYVKSTELPNVLNGYGIAVVSTPRGIMSNREARKVGLGGEVICEIY